jgi:hypothetical protein
LFDISILIVVNRSEGVDRCLDLFQVLTQRISVSQKVERCLENHTSLLSCDLRAFPVDYPYISYFRFSSNSTHNSSSMTQPGKPTAGVLQIPAAATQKPGAPAKKAPKPPTPRLKLLIRRLPPGLTQTELEAALGQDWKVGGGKVDWLQYKPGKVSKEYGSRPGN